MFYKKKSISVSTLKKNILIECAFLYLYVNVQQSLSENCLHPIV